MSKSSSNNTGVWGVISGVLALLAFLGFQKYTDFFDDRNIVTLHGRVLVKNVQEQPFQGVLVKISSNSDYTDEKGTFIINDFDLKSKNSVKLVFSHDDIRVVTKTINLDNSKAHHDMGDFYLEPKSSATTSQKTTVIIQKDTIIVPGNSKTLKEVKIDQEPNTANDQFTVEKLCGTEWERKQNRSGLYKYMILKCDGEIGYKHKLRSNYIFNQYDNWEFVDQNLILRWFWEGGSGKEIFPVKEITKAPIFGKSDIHPAQISIEMIK